MQIKDKSMELRFQPLVQRSLFLPCESGLQPVSPHWYLTRDGDKDGLALYERHYSCYRYKDGRIRKLFCGPGFKMVLISPDGDALFVWKKFIDGSGQKGINCPVFRNESGARSSTLIREADALAWERWPGERLYTYVNPRAIRSINPGFCFKAAGWRSCGKTKGNLLVLEHLPWDVQEEPKCTTH